MKFVRFRKKKVLIGGLWGALIMFIIASVILVFWYTSAKDRQILLEKEYEEKVKEYEAWAGQNKKVYSLKEDIEAGAPITEDMLQEVIVPANGSAENVVHKSFFDFEVGLFAKVDMKANTILTEAVIYEDEYLEADIRENQFSYIVLPDKLEPESFVDVRIQFPNGDDYIVLSKKKAKDLNSATIWMDLNEGEMLTMSSAVVDAYLEEAKIYAVTYVDGLVQKEATITYPVKENVKELMQENPNIVNIAKFHLEKQNRKRLEDYLSKMTEEDKATVRNGEESSREESNNSEADESQSTYDEVFEDDGSNSTNKE